MIYNAKGRLKGLMVHYIARVNSVGRGKTRCGRVLDGRCMIVPDTYDVDCMVCLAAPSPEGL